MGIVSRHCTSLPPPPPSCFHSGQAHPLTQPVSTPPYMPPQGVQGTHWSQGRVSRPKEARSDDPWSPRCQRWRGPETCAAVVVRLLRHFLESQQEKSALKTNTLPLLTAILWWDAKRINSSVSTFLSSTQQSATTGGNGKTSMCRCCCMRISRCHLMLIAP